MHMYARTCTQETERTLFMLSVLGPLLGHWQAALPGGPLAMRRAACELLRFVAQPSTDHRYRAHAGPISEAERRAARQPWELHINEGEMQCMEVDMQRHDAYLH